uniref:Uncharacterized protein n=1 Tax=Oryza barthii TaxID=65489 RepID=A0A0G2KBM1_9ORYZ
MGLNRPRGIS